MKGGGGTEQNTKLKIIKKKVLRKHYPEQFRILHNNRLDDIHRFLFKILFCLMKLLNTHSFEV
jgi:hypothetical protein